MAFVFVLPGFTCLSAAPITVSEIVPGSLAEAAGFHSGDVIISVDGHEFSSLDEFLAYVRPTGATYVFAIQRQDKTPSITVQENKGSFGLQVSAQAQSASSQSTSETPVPILRLDPQGHSAIVNDVAFAPDGTELATASDDKTIRVWDVATGEQKRVIRGWLSDGDEGKIYALAIDPTGRYLACGGWFKGTNGTELGPGAIRILDYHSGDLITLLKGHEEVIDSLCFSPDGRLLASGDGNGMIKLWRTTDWQEGPRLTQAHSDEVFGLAFSPDGALLASASFDRSIRIVSTRDGSLVARKEYAHEGEVHDIAWSPDGKLLATGGLDGHVSQWNPGDLSPMGVAKEVDTDFLSEVAFLDSKTLVCGGTYHELHDGEVRFPIYVIDLETKTERVFWGHTNAIMHMAVMADGHTIASTGGNNSETLIWDARTLTTLQTLAGNGRTVWAVAFDKQGTSICYGTTNQGGSFLETPLQKCFDLTDRTISDQPPSDAGQNRALLEYGGEKLSFSGELYHRTLQVGSRSVTLPSQYDTIRTYTYTPDGRYIIVGSDHGLYRIDAKTLEITGEFVGHEGIVCSVSVSPDSKTLVSGGGDQTIRFWDIEGFQEKPTFRDASWFDGSWIDYIKKHYPDININKPADVERLYHLLVDAGDPDDASELLVVPQVKPLLSLFIGSDNEWLAWTPEGYFDCSLDGAKYAGWHFNRGEDQTAEFYSLEQYSSVFYRPDIITRALNREHLSLPSVSFETRPPTITDFKINGQENYDQGEITVETDKPEFDIQLASTGTTTLKLPELFYNGRVISQGSFKGPPQVSFAADRQSLSATYSFSVTSRENDYKIYTVDARGFKSAAKILHVRYTGPDAQPAFYRLGEKVAPPTPGGTLFVVAVGINTYTNPAMAAAGMGNLTYAEKDAADMAALFAGQQGKLFNRVDITVLTREKLGRDVTRADILDAIAAIGKKSLTEKDSILVFLSGHGLRKDDGFFFLSSEADPTSKDSLMATSPSWVEIGERLKSYTTAKEIVVMIDACHSGAVSPMELGVKWKDMGVLLFTSCRSGQKSYEGGSYEGSVFENGLFTKAIIEGFTRAAATSRAPADSSQDDVLIIGEVLNYAIQKVGEWTGGMQTPWVPAYDPAIEGKILGVVR